MKLISNDDKTFEVSSEIMSISEFIKGFTEETETPEETQLDVPNVHSKELEKIIKFCEYYYKNPFGTLERPVVSSKMEEIVPEWYAKFVDTENKPFDADVYPDMKAPEANEQPVVYFDNITENPLTELLNAANYMVIRPLIELCCAKIATIIKNVKSEEEINQIFGISDKLTEEELNILENLKENEKWIEPIV